MKRVSFSKADRDILVTLALSSGVSILLLATRMIVTDSSRFWFLIWNLILAWIPLGFAYGLYRRLAHKRWPEWPDFIIAGLWLGFLPNSFYLLTDLIHLQSSGEVSLLYDTALLASFVLNGLIVGYLSLYMVHRLATRYLGERGAYIMAQSVLLLCGFAIYLGRYLRWNTWDVIINPAGLVFDVSDRIINPATHLHTFVVTGVFYIVLGSIYAVLYRLIQLVRTHKL